MKKFFVSILTTTIMAMPIIAGAQDNLLFALVPKVADGSFFGLARDGCKKAESELDNVECLYIGPGKHTELDQIQIVEDLITRGVNGIAVAPSNAPAMAKVLETAKDAGIPVITWDSDVPAEDAGMRASYIGTRNYDIGVNLARATMKLKPQSGTICIQSGDAAAAGYNERMQGLRDTLSGTQSDSTPGERLTGQGGWIEVDGCPLYTDDDSPLSVQQMDDILTRYPNLAAFVATGGFPQSAPEAYRRVTGKYIDRIQNQDTLLVIADTLPVQMEMLKDGLSHAQVGQRPYEMGYKAMFILKDLVEGKEVDDPVYIDLDVCESANQDSCLSD